MIDREKHENGEEHWFSSPHESMDAQTDDMSITVVVAPRLHECRECEDDMYGCPHAPWPAALLNEIAALLVRWEAGEFR